MTERALTYNEVRHKTGLGRTTVWKLEQKGAFPRRRRFGKKAVRWLESEVDQWLRDMEVVEVA